jgi:hypothetical protein
MPKTWKRMLPIDAKSMTTALARTVARQAVVRRRSAEAQGSRAMKTKALVRGSTTITNTAAMVMVFERSATSAIALLSSGSGAAGGAAARGATPLRNADGGVGQAGEKPHTSS